MPLANATPPSTGLRWDRSMVRINRVSCPVALSRRWESANNGQQHAGSGRSTGMVARRKPSEPERTQLVYVGTEMNSGRTGQGNKSIREKSARLCLATAKGSTEIGLDIFVFVSDDRHSVQHILTSPIAKCIMIAAAAIYETCKTE